MPACQPTTTEGTEGRMDKGSTNWERLTLELRDVAIPQARIKVKHIKTTVRVRKSLQIDSCE